MTNQVSKMAEKRQPPSPNSRQIFRNLHTAHSPLPLSLRRSTIWSCSWLLSCKPAQGEGGHTGCYQKSSKDGCHCPVCPTPFSSAGCQLSGGQFFTTAGQDGDLNSKAVLRSLYICHHTSQILKCRVGNSALIYGLGCKIEILSQIGWGEKIITLGTKSYPF